MLGWGWFKCSLLGGFSGGDKPLCALFSSYIIHQLRGCTLWPLYYFPLILPPQFVWALVVLSLIERLQRWLPFFFVIYDMSTSSMRIYFQLGCLTCRKVSLLKRCSIFFAFSSPSQDALTFSSF